MSENPTGVISTTYRRSDMALKFDICASHQEVEQPADGSGQAAYGGSELYWSNLTGIQKGNANEASHIGQQCRCCLTV